MYEIWWTGQRMLAGASQPVARPRLTAGLRASVRLTTGASTMNELGVTRAAIARHDGVNAQ